MRKLYHYALAAIGAILTLSAGLASCSGSHQERTADYRIVPLPNSIDTLSGESPLTIKGSVSIEADPALSADKDRLAELLGKVCGLSVGSTGTKVTLSVDTNIVNEGYVLRVSPEGIAITGGDGAGVMYGANALVKAIGAGKKGSTVVLPSVEIKDSPRFPYRGSHLDVSRHFFEADSVKKFLDILALHNVNNFHWHLTDDQGWRMESKKYPKLVEVGSNRKQTVIGHNSGEYDGTPYGGYYTQDEIRDIVDYAAKLHINVIPEIDLPGHMVAALAAYPELGCTGGPYEVWEQWGVSDDVLCAGNPDSYKFVTDILDEVMDLFPSKMIHIGGDECPKTRWKDCPKCQAMAAKLPKQPGVDPFNQLQNHFMHQAVEYLADHGRRVIGWDEILEGGAVDSSAIVQSWRGIGGAVEAAKRGNDTFMSPTSNLYFDYYQTDQTENEPTAFGGLVTLKNVYDFDPVPSSLSAEEAAHIIGLQPNLWTEYVTSFPQVQYMELPRLAAAAERQWVDNSTQRDYPEFLERVAALMEIYDALGFNYARHALEIRPEYSLAENENAMKVTFHTPDNAEIRYTLDGSDPATGTVYTEPILIKESSHLRATALREGQEPTPGIDEEFICGKSTFLPLTLATKPHPNYTYEGAITLSDGIHGGNLYRTGRWLGFYNTDFEGIFDFGEPQEISSVSFNTNVNQGDWIFDAAGVEVSVSDDGENFRKVFSKDFEVPDKFQDAHITNHSYTFDKVNARYVKVIVKVLDKIPAWHGGAGSPTFLFIDEVTLN